MDELAARRAQDEHEGFPADVIAQVKERHPSLELRMYIGEDGDAVICKAPNRGEYKRFRQMVVDPDKRAMALETLLFGCCVHPSTAELSSLLEKRPGLAEVFGDKLSGWAGAGQEVTEKKL